MQLSDYIAFPQLTPGRSKYIVKHMPEDVAQAPGVGARLTAVHDTAQALSDVRKAYDRSRSASQARGKAVALDNAIDRIIGAVAHTAQANLNAMPEDDPVHVASAKLLRLILPLGASAVTTLPFEDELNAVQGMLADLDGQPGLAEAAGVSHLIERLRTLTPAFEAELNKTKTIVEFKQVEAAQARMQTALMLLVAQLIATWGDDPPALSRAFAPIDFQCSRVRALRSSRRTVRDVDPESGEEIDE